MDKEKPGRRNPDDPKLKNAQLILQIGLRKDWADKCSYWIEIFDVTKKHTQLFYVYRQWSFFKKDENRLIADGILSRPSTSLTTAVMQTVDYLRRRTDDSGDIVVFMKEHPDYSGIAEQIECEVGMRESIALKTKIKDREPTLAEKFKESQLERQRKAKW